MAIESARPYSHAPSAPIHLTCSDARTSQIFDCSPPAVRVTSSRRDSASAQRPSRVAIAAASRDALESEQPRASSGDAGFHSAVGAVPALLRTRSLRICDASHRSQCTSRTEGEFCFLFFAEQERISISRFTRRPALLSATLREGDLRFNFSDRGDSMRRLIGSGRRRRRPPGLGFEATFERASHHCGYRAQDQYQCFADSDRTRTVAPTSCLHRFYIFSVHDARPTRRQIRAAYRAHVENAHRVRAGKVIN